MICLKPKPSQSFFVYKAKKKFSLEKKDFNESGEWKIEQKRKIRLFRCSLYGDKEGLHTKSIRKHANKLKAQEKTMKTAIKQGLSWELNLDYAKLRFHTLYNLFFKNFFLKM